MQHLHGDVLESVVERVPAPDLAAAALVSREWLRAVRAALRRRMLRLPWLVVHVIHLRGQRRHAAAYDPRSGAWLAVPTAPPARHGATSPPQPHSHVRLMRGASGDRVCALSLSGLAVARDALGMDDDALIVALKAPGVWRVDPVLAAVGDRLVAMGGGCRLALGDGEDTSAVEVHERGGWTHCGAVPAALRESAAAAATWLSTAATDQRVYVADRATGTASWFDPAKQQWGPTSRLRPDAAVSTWGLAAGRAGAEKIILFGVKHADSRVVIRSWEVDGDSLSLSHGAAAAHDTMPSEMSERLFPHGDDGEEETSSPSIGVCGNTAGGYVYNAAVPATGAVLYELRRGGVEGGGVERWAWVACAPVVAEAEALGRVILACSPVGLHELADERLAH
ncbi:F-box/kelch-repeat protein At1g23390-like [Oryza glaberrima]|uniref:Uncharacterized protein n=1 Tax=Oryza glaberrima TaxID=4538 RepID=I1QMP2_ORYGL|nr:F-box/kelch-repeat protein At1g23390-like [Oryza glaberrima]